MTPKEFRRMALSMPEAIEASHMGHPDFRVGKKIFATMGYPDAASAMVKLTPEQQSVLVAAEPEIFLPVPGGWGRTGSTNVRLKAADAKTLKSALVTAWRNIAPTSLVQGKDGGRSSRKGVAAKGAGDGLGRALARMRRAVKGSNLPDIEEVQSFGTPALKVRGKLLARVKDADTLVFRCPIEMKEILIESAPEIYFETDHYKGWPAILLRLSKAGDAELLTCLDRAWRLQAPKRLRDQHEAHGIRAPKLPDGSRPAKGRNRR